MVKKIGTAFFALVVTVAALAQEPGVKWFKGGVDKAVEAAKKEDKIIFIDFYAEWCYPCKMLDKMVWQDPDSARQIKAMKVIPMKMDAEKEGLDAARKYSVRSYPTILFIDGEGKEIARIAGFRDKDDVIENIRKNCADPRTIESMKAEHEKNPGDLILAAGLAKKLQAAGTRESVDEAKAMLEKIFKGDPDNGKGIGAQALVDRLAIGLEELDAIERRLRSIDSVRRHLGNEVTLMWDEEPMKFADIESAIKLMSSGASRRFGEIAEPKLKAVLARAEKLRGATVNIENIMNLEDTYITGAENPDTREISNIYFDIAACFAKDATSLNEIAWHNYSVQRKLEESAKFAEKAVELGNDPNCMDTLAHVLMSLGMKEKAIQKEKEAIAILKSKGDDKRAAEFERALKLFENNELDQLAAGVTPLEKRLKRAEEK
ncbi:MAG TPA: thioredoxin domain-containing protein [Acidobacteriota bacterium]|nr:thioredoxin domain-containing protein [Acidobacteriota bacterium]